jgi:hypothetical protein
MLLLEKAIADEGDEEIRSSVQAIRDALAENQNKLLNEYQVDLENLSTQQEIIQHALSVQDLNRLSEIEQIILEEVGDLEDSEDFKDRVKTANLEMRQDFLRVINEIKDVVREGALEELMDLLEASALEGDKEGLENDEEDEDEEDDETEVDETCQETEVKSCTAEKDVLSCKDSDEDCECLLPFNLSTNSKIVDFLKQHADPYFVEKNSKPMDPDKILKKK